MSSGLDEVNHYVGELPTVTCRSRGINVLAICNLCQKFSPNALRSTSTPTVDISSVSSFFSLLACLGDYLVTYLTLSPVPCLTYLISCSYFELLNISVRSTGNAGLEGLRQERVWSIVERWNSVSGFRLHPFATLSPPQLLSLYSFISICMDALNSSLSLPSSPDIYLLFLFLALTP